MPKQPLAHVPNDTRWFWQECADYAVRAHEPYGIWGGLTEEERVALTRRALGIA